MKNEEETGTMQCMGPITKRRMHHENRSLRQTKSSGQNDPNPARWFPPQGLAVTLHLADEQLVWLHQGLHYAIAEHTLEGGQSTQRSFNKPADVINHKAVALACSAWVIIRNQAGTGGPKLEMTSSALKRQCPVADVSWNWVTPPLPPSLFHLLYSGA